MKKFVLFLSSLFVLILACAACGNRAKSGDAPVFAELGKNPQVGVWYKVSPEGAVISTGAKWNGFYRKGKENKLVVYFYGGGVSVDGYTAARGSTVAGDDSYYFDFLGENDGEPFVKGIEEGLAKPDDVNPFKDWTIIMLPYATGDFHCGTGERQYTSLTGETKTLYYHGYTNFRSFMDMVLPYIGTPDALLVTGSSAGGFGTAILADDVAGYFPATKNVTAVVDASILITDKSKQIARDEWKAPEHIVARINGDNMTLDCLNALHKDKPYVKIMFGITARDEILTHFQHYFVDGTRPSPTKEDGEAFQQITKQMVADLQEGNPEIGLNIWDDGKTNELGLTTHTIETNSDVFLSFNGDKSYADWIMDAVNGKVEKLGLDRLN